jgi:hypothetical protein
VIPALLFEADAERLMFVPDTAGVLQATAVSTLIVLGCGMVPLLENRHDRPGAVLQRDPRRPAKSLHALRRILVVFQMAACCALAIATASLNDALDATFRLSAGDRRDRLILATVESSHDFTRPDLG